MEEKGDKTAEEEKMGCPTDNLKSRPIHVWLGAEADATSEAYCVRENATRVGTIRRGISLLGKQN